MQCTKRQALRCVEQCDETILVSSFIIVFYPRLPSGDTLTYKFVYCMHACIYENCLKAPDSYNIIQLYCNIII